MKRKFLAALLALVMVFSMIPVSASAEEAIKVTGDTPLQTPALSVTFKIHTTQLYKLLMNEAEIDSLDPDEIKIQDVYLLLDKEHYLGGEHHFSNVGFTLAETDYLSLVMQENDLTLQPDNIRGLRISYTSHGSSKSIELTPGDLWLECKVIPGNSATEYTVKSSNESKAIVAFYDNGESGQETAYSLYQVYLVDRNSMLGESKWPKNPDYIGYTFIGWGTEKKGGSAPFLPTSTVSEDTEVFSQKVTSEVSGTEIRVINENNALKKRFVELYNAEHQTSLNIDSSSINWNSMKISIHGNDEKSTNPNYNNLIDKNEWKDNDNYYRIVNYDADIWGLDQYINHHVAPQNITGMTVWVEVNGVSSPVDISRGTAEGSFEVSMQSDVIAKLYIKAAPTPPNSDELENPDDNTIFPTGAVTIDCTNEQADHVDKTYSLIAGTYTVSKSATWVSDGEGSGYYTAEVTIDFDKVDQYVTKYATEYVDVTHTLVPEQDDKTITLIWQNGKWVADNSAPVKYKVACETEPEDETPPAPDPAEFDISVTVACTNNPSDHAVKYYDNLLKNSYTLGTVTQKGTTYEYTITVQSEKYVEEYSTDYGPHELYANSEPAITVKFIYSDEKWEIPADSKLPVFYVTCAESGEEQPTPPSITSEDVITLMGDNAIEVACKTEGSGHNPSSYSLIPGSFTVGSVTPDENGQYSCKITIDENGILQYVDAYDEVVGSEHTAISFGPITFTITYDGIKWLQPKLPAATIKVVCVPDQEDELDDDDLNGILGGAITVQCISEEQHDYKILTADKLLENAYSATKNADGTYTVTLDGDKYASAYGTYVSDKIGMGENIPHQLVNEEDAAFEIKLTHDGINWTFVPDPIVIKVTCEDGSGEEPTPTPNPGPDPDPDPDPDPTPTPTPDPGDDDKPPYIPPVDPDDSGVSDLLNTDDHIQYLFGYPEGTFGPENNMTRAEVAQMFYNLLLDQDVTITKTFDDVPAGAWYAKAVNTLASLGVVSGVGNGDFEPERSITRAEFTSIAMKFAEGKTGGTNIFSDVKSTDWFYRAVVNSTQYGWIHGYGDGTFRPNNPITRVEVTAIVNNMLGREADVDFVTEHYDELNHFSDLAVSHWGYYHIVEATNDHDYTKPSSGENWTELN